MAADGPHRALERGARIGRRRTIAIERPVLGNLLAFAGMQFDVAAGDRARGEVENERIIVRARPCERDGIGAEYRPLATFRCFPAVARIHREADGTQRSDRFDFRPQRGKMETAIDRHCRDALRTRLLGELGLTGLERQQRKAMVRIDRKQTRRDIAQHRFSTRIDLAALDRAHAAYQPIDAVRVAFVALPLHDHARNGIGVRRRRPVPHEYVASQRKKFV